MGTKSRVTPAWNFKGMLMENNSRVITNADATLTQKIYDYGEVSPEQSSVTVVKDDDMAHFYFNICSEKGEPAYIKITKDDDGNIVITGTDHSGTTQQTILASKIELTENDKGVLISVLATENGELIKKEAQVYDSTISVEEKDYGALVTMTNSKGTSSEAKLYSPTISAERLEDNTGVKIIIVSGKEGATPTVVNLYDPIVTGKRVTGGAEITIQNHIDEEPKIINLYDAGSASIAPEYDETQEYKKFNYCIYNNTMYVCLEDTTGPFDETKWKETKVSYELDNVSLKIVAEDWDGSKTYSIGDYVMYDKILYKCISNEEGSETAYPNITASKWKTIFIMDEIPNIATTEKAGIVKVGKNLEITEDGTLNAKAGGGNANEMELTWAEYLALTDEEKNNGTTYYITDKNPTSSEKGFKSTLLATLNDQPQEIDFSNYDLILYQAYNSEVNLYSSAVFMPSFINRAGNIILSIDVTDRIIIDSTNAITLNAFNCAIDVYGMNFVGSSGEGGSGLPEVYIGDTEPTDDNIKLFVNTNADYEPTGNYNETILWEAGTPLQAGGVATLSDSYFNYHALYIYRSTPGDKETTPARLIIYTVPISALKEGLEVGNEGYLKRYIYIKGSADGMSINCTISGTNNSEDIKYTPAIYKIVGVKYEGLTLVEQPGGASSLADLTDVYIQNLEDKQILSYNSSAKRWENIEVNFSSDVKYAKLYFDSDNGNTVKPASTTVPLTFDNVIGNLKVIDNQKIKLEKGKIYLTYAQGQKGNWSGSLYINIRNSQEQIISQSGADTNYTGVSVSTIYKCEIDNDYLYYSSSNGQGTDSGSSHAFSTQFFVVELNGSGSGETSSTNSEYHKYSTDEQVIGEWIDGKPLYEKTVNFILGSANTYNQYTLDIKNAETIWIDYSNSFTFSNEGTGIITGIMPYSSNISYNEVKMYVHINDDGTSGIDYRVYSTNANQPCYVTLKYTKTTD